MKAALALVAATAVASCTYDDVTSERRDVDDSTLRWISIGTDALDTARALAPIESVEVNGDIALVLIAEHDLAPLSRAMHEQHDRCGGFIVHDSLDEARRAVAAASRERTLQLAAPYTIDNAAVVNRLLPALDESSLLAMIHQLSETFTSRYHNTTGGLAVPGWLRDQWAGYATGRTDVTVELFAHTGFEQRSVIATITGTTKPDEVIVIGAHIDSIASGGTGAAPGADDDASGIATISEVLRVLMAKKFKPERTVKIMAYAAEEIGLRGSRSIVADFVAKNINVVGVMQFDMTNYKGSAKDIYLMQDFTNPAQNTFVGTLIDTYVGATWGTSQCGYGCSDHASWHNEGFAASMPAEARFEDTNPTIHSTGDTLDVSNNTATHALKFARLATSYVAELAKGELVNGAPVVTITAPGTDDVHPAATPVELVATALDEEDGELSGSIEWSSDRDGPLGTGAVLSTKLSVGMHQITATVRDSAGADGQATTSLAISNEGDDDGDGSGLGGGCAAGGSGGLAAACASLLACLARRRRRMRRY